ncbi:MAG: hypothetical protein IPG78_07120 [Ignavibacteria bacterium]|nr:hypothetical protein [Ignavibacteria bacterium]
MSLAGVFYFLNQDGNGKKDTTINLINNWIKDTNNKNLNYNKYYTDKVNYYKFGIVDYQQS